MTGVHDLRSVRETAAILNVSARTVQRLVARGDLPAIRVGSQLRISSGEIANYLKAGAERVFEERA